MTTYVSMNLLNPIGIAGNRQRYNIPIIPKSTPTMQRTPVNGRRIKMEIGNNSRSTLVMKRSRGCSSCGGAR